MKEKSVYDQIIEDMRNEDSREPAGLGIRLVSLILDLMVIGYVTSLLGSSILYKGGFGLHVDGLGAIVFVSYYWLFDWSPLQGTPSKFLLGLTVVDEDGDRLSFWKAGLRLISRTATALTLFLGFSVALFRDDKRTLHDIMSSTYVLKDQKQ